MQARRQRRLLGAIHAADVRRLAADLERVEGLVVPEQPRDAPDEVRAKLARMGMRYAGG